MAIHATIIHAVETDILLKEQRTVSPLGCRSNHASYSNWKMQFPHNRLHRGLLTARIIDAGGYCRYRNLLLMLGIVADIGIVVDVKYCCSRRRLLLILGIIIDAGDY